VKTRIIQSQAELMELAGRIVEAADSAVATLGHLCRSSSSFQVLASIKFKQIGADPLQSTPLNLIEQVNQTFTYLASLEAVHYLLNEHTEHAPFRVNLGTASGSDVESLDGKVAAEVFSAVSPSNNQKLKKDIEKVNATDAQHRYVFYACPNYPTGETSESYHPTVRVISLGCNFTNVLEAT
jgi:hypothetical protein